MKNPPEEPTGLPLRAAAMVLIAAAIVFAGLGWLSLGKSNPDSQADTATAAATSSLTSSAPAPTAAQAPAGAVAAATRSGSVAASTTTSGSAVSGSPADASTVAAVPVRVFNNSDVSGLASRTASQLRSEGWTISAVQNYTAGSVPKTTVYYGTGVGEQQAAQKIAQELGATAEPRFAGIKDATPGVIVILAGNPTG